MGGMEPRSSQLVLDKLASLLSSGGEAEEGRQYWMPDDISVECYDCTSKFTTLRRRHHCRICGQVFCSKCCSSSIPGKHLGRSGSLRVCSFCFGYFQNYQAQAPGGPNENEGPERGGSSGTLSRLGRRQSIDDVAQMSLTASPTSFKVPRKASTALYSGGTLDNSGEDATFPGSAPQETVKLRDPSSLARLWERVVEPGAGLPLKTNRYYFRSYPDTFEGSCLVSWLIGQDSHATSRAQAVAIGQALLTAGFIRAISGQLQFIDSSELYTPGQPHIQEEEQGGDASPLLMEPAWLQELADSPFRPEKRSSASSRAAELHRKRSAEEEERRKKKIDDLPDGGIQTVEHTIGELKEVGVAEVGLDTEEAEALEAAYREHEANYLTALLTAANVEESWRSTLLRLAEEAVTTVVPDMKKNTEEEMDVRAYVKVKCVAGGSKEESRLVAGEVCSLQLAHKRMAPAIFKPRIALVANSIVFQREESRFVSLDTLAMQEEEYIKNVTGRLLACKPNLVLVERTVSRLAQEILLAEGVSLALNVKFQVLQRLARLTQGTIISSVDSMLPPPRLGTCEQFYSQKSGPARLLVFEGCQPSLGGTLLLQGGDTATLARVKTVLRRLLLLKQTWLGEKSLLANEYGALPGTLLGECEEENVKEEEEEMHLAMSPFIKVKPVKVDLTCRGPVVEAHDVTDDGDESAVEEEAVEVKEELHEWAKDFLGYKITLPCSEDPKLSNKLALFRAAGRRAHGTRTKTVLKSAASKRHLVMLPEDHCERLSVQFSMYSSQSCLAPNYCVAPWVVEMELFGHLDISLGDFLTRHVFSPGYVCPNESCSTPPLLHTRRFCHAGGAVSLHMQRLEAPIVGEENEKLMMWKYCTSCELITNIVPVTDATWCLSFAQFLHILLHERKLVRRGASRPDAKCTHSLHQEHLTIFGKQDLVATFKYNKLQVHQLSTPPSHLILPPSTPSRASLLSALSTVKDSTNSLHSAVLERLLAAKAEGGPGIETVCQEAETERAEHREQLQALEEELVDGQVDIETNHLLRLQSLQKDLIASRSSWTKKLAGVEVRGRQLRPVNRSSSQEALDTAGKAKTLEDTTTVKKLISTILPHTEESIELPSVLAADIHLIEDAFIVEGKPSSMISHLLSSSQHRAFIESETGEKHMVLEFASGTAKFYCCSYFSREFHNLRQIIFPDGLANFVSSLEDCRRWEAMGGKSGLLFYKTTDDRFILKQMSRFEYQSFLEFAPHYFQYLEQCVEKGEKTLLAKIVGVFKIAFKNSTTGHGMNLEFLVMENLFFGKEVSKSYDLKGSIRNRLMAEADGAVDGQVLLDENLIRVSCESPLYIGQADKEALNEAVQRDTAFLAKHEMMDYSLLAGICLTNNELVVGIIDYIRTFTWDKKLETLVKSVKSSGVFGGQAKTPTVIKPDIYKDRFTYAMSRYFSSVPD